MPSTPGETSATPRIIKPCDWEIVREGSFYVAVENLPDEPFYILVWKADEYFASGGKVPPVLKSTLQRIGSGVSVAHIVATKR